MVRGRVAVWSNRGRAATAGSTDARIQVFQELRLFLHRRAISAEVTERAMLEDARLTRDAGVAEWQTLRT